LIARYAPLIIPAIISISDVCSDIWMVSFWYLHGYSSVASLILVTVVLSGYFLWWLDDDRNKVNQNDRNKANLSLRFSDCVIFIIHLLGFGQLIHFQRFLYAQTKKDEAKYKNRFMVALRYEAYYESVPSLVITGYIIVLSIYSD